MDTQNKDAHGHSECQHQTDCHGHDDHHHPKISWWHKYIFSTDHKVIGLQYGLTALSFLAFGFCLVMLMRWQLAYPGRPTPIIGTWIASLPEGSAMKTFTHTFMPDGIMTPDFYNSLGAMHGTIMVFMGIVPLVVGAFGNYIVPLQIGAPDMAFPRLNMASYWFFFTGGVTMLVSFFLPGGAANAGWTAYPPLANITTMGQTFWLIGMVCLINSSLLGGINFIVTIVQMRAKGLTWMRLPFFVWTQLITAFLLVLAFPPLEAAGVLQLMDRVAGTSFFMPTGLVVSQQLWPTTGGGSPILWQHLFWFLGHPEVYVLILPAFGILGEILTNNTRKPLWGYRTIIYSLIFLFFMSFIVWAHHMYLTGMGTAVSTFFQTTTMIISIPSIIILTAMILSLWGGSIRFNTPMLFALAFLPMFGIGGFTGLPLGLAAPDIALHDTYYVIGHFHYVIAPGTIFAIFAGIYFWFPKITGRKMSETLGQLHFWPSLVMMNFIFMPMFVQGMAGMSRRLYDGGNQYLHTMSTVHLNITITHAAFGLAIAQIPFIINLFWSIKFGQKVCANPWSATTLEWTAPSPPPHGNFKTIPEVYRGAYEYSVPGESKDFILQSEPAKS